MSKLVCNCTLDNDLLWITKIITTRDNFGNDKDYSEPL